MLNRLDWQLIAAAGIVVLLGLLIHYSLAPETIALHVVYVCVGLIGGFVASQLDYQSISAFYWHIFASLNALLLITPIIGATAKGSTRWIEIGSFRFQPAELAKLLLIISLAQLLLKIKLASIPEQLKAMTLVGIPFILVFIQPDLGSAIIIGLICAGMFFAAGMRIKHLLMYIGSAVLLSPFLWLFLEEYQKSRITTFLNPTADPLGKGYNTIQAIIAVGSGQITGRGLGHGTQTQLRFLPEYRTDFVFAAFAEELGLIGCLILLAAFSWMLWRLFVLTRDVQSHYGYLALVGITSMFAAQILINIGMNVGLLPITGITLPLVSSGGTSLVVSLTTIGVALKLGQDKQNRSGIEIRGKDQ